MAVLSFRSVPFELLAEGGDWVPASPPPETLESRRTVPYGNITIVDDGGFGLSIWPVEIRVLPANVAAMLANLSQIGALVTNDGTFANSKLSKLTNRRGTPSPGGSSRTYVAFSAEFIVSA